MGALSRLQEFFLQQLSARPLTFAAWATQFPIEILKTVPGLTVGTASDISAPEWDSSTTYTAGSKVSYSGQVYLALVDSTNLLPTETAYWSSTTADSYPTQDGETTGELFLATNYSSPQLFVWANNIWTCVGVAGRASGSGSGSGGGGSSIPITGSVGYDQLSVELRNSLSQQFADEANARIAGIAQEANLRAADIYSESLIRSSADESMASQISLVLSRTNNNSAAILTEQNTRTSQNSAMASQITSVTTTVNGHTTAIQTNATSIDGIKAQYTVTIDNNGYVSGFGLASDIIDHKPTSAFAIVADRFSMWAPGATILAPDMVAGTHYTILTVGNSNFMAVGASANEAGIVFQATGSTSGSGTVSKSTPIAPFVVDVASNPPILQFQGTIIADKVVAGNFGELITVGSNRIRLDGPNEFISVNDGTVARATLGKLNGIDYGLELRDSSNNVILTTGGSTPGIRNTDGTFVPFAEIATNGQVPPINFIGNFDADPSISSYPLNSVYKNNHSGDSFILVTNTSPPPSKKWQLYLAKGEQGPAGVSAAYVTLSATSQLFQVAKNSGGTTPTSIDFTATYGSALTPVSPNPYTVTSGTATLTGSGTSRNLTYSNLATDAATIRFSATDGINTYSDSITVVKVREGDDAITVILTNESVGVPADQYGTVIDLSGAVTNIRVFIGAVEVSSNAEWSYSRTNSSTDITSHLTGRTLTVDTLTADSAYVDITATRTVAGSVVYTQDRRFNVARINAGATGAAGAGAKILSLATSSQVVQVAQTTGILTPTTINLIASLSGSLSGTVNWLVTSGTITGGIGATGLTNSFSTSNMATDAVTIRARVTDGSINYDDYVTIIKVKEGSNAYNSYLTNESVTLAASNSGSVSDYSPATTNIVTYMGPNDDTGNWAFYNPSSWSTSGIASLGYNYTTPGYPTVSVSSMTSDNAWIDIKISKGSLVTTKRFSLSKSKMGTNGTNGTDGTPGIRGSRTFQSDLGNTPKPSVPPAPVGETDLYTYLNAAVTAGNSFPPVRGDIVNLQGSTYTTPWAATYTSDGILYSGSYTGWTPVTTILDGGLLVKGTVVSDAIKTGTITADRLIITGAPSACFNADPYFKDSTNWGWEGTAGIIGAAVTDGIGTVVRSAVGTAFSFIYEKVFHPIDPSKKYRVRFFARASAGANGVLYFCLRQWQDQGVTPCGTNSGRSPYKPAGISIGTTWTEYSYQWDSTDWQSNAKYLQLNWLLNYAGSSGYMEICNARFEEMSSADLIVDGAITADKIQVGAVTADKIQVGAVTADKIQANAIKTGNYAFSGTEGSATEIATAGAKMQNNSASVGYTPALLVAQGGLKIGKQYVGLATALIKAAGDAYMYSDGVFWCTAGTYAGKWVTSRGFDNCLRIRIPGRANQFPHFASQMVSMYPGISVMGSNGISFILQSSATIFDMHLFPVNIYYDSYTYAGETTGSWILELLACNGNNMLWSLRDSSFNSGYIWSLSVTMGTLYSQGNGPF